MLDQNLGFNPDDEAPSEGLHDEHKQPAEQVPQQIEKQVTDLTEAAEQGIPEPQVPEAPPEQENSSEREEKESKESEIPLMDIEDLDRILTIGEVYGKFNENLNKKGPDNIVLLTGNSRGIKASIEAVREHNGDSPTNFVEWSSEDYAYGHGAGPNAIVYKDLQETTIQHVIYYKEAYRHLGGGLVNRGGELLTQFSEAEVSKFLSGAQTTQEYAGNYQSALSETFEPQNFERTLKLAQFAKTNAEAFENMLHQSNLSDKEKANLHWAIDDHIKLLNTYKSYMRSFRGTQISDFDTLDNFEQALPTFAKRAHPENNGRLDYVLPTGELRVSMMRILYPQHIASLFQTLEDGRASFQSKEITYFDNVNISGKKLDGYTDFFRALSVSDRSVDFHILFSKGLGPRIHNKGYERYIITTYQEFADKQFVDYGEREFRALTGNIFDEKTQFEFPENSTDSELREWIKYQIGLKETLTKAQQAVESLIQEPLHEAAFRPDSISRVYDYLIDHPNTVDSPIVTSSYETDETFEKDFQISDFDKSHTVIVREVLDDMVSKLSNLPQEGEPQRVVIQGIDNYMLIQHFIKDPRYQALSDRYTFICINNGLDISKRDLDSALFIFTNVPRFHPDMHDRENWGYSLYDSRKKRYDADIRFEREKNYILNDIKRLLRDEEGNPNSEVLKQLQAEVANLGLEIPPSAQTQEKLKELLIKLKIPESEGNFFLESLVKELPEKLFNEYVLYADLYIPSSNIKVIASEDQESHRVLDGDDINKNIAMNTPKGIAQIVRSIELTRYLAAQELSKAA